MDIPGFFKNIFVGGAKELVTSITGLIDESKFSAEEKAANELKITEAVNEHIIKMAGLAHEEAELKLKETTIRLMDIANARAMQIEALKQEDKLSKRFIYYLSAFMVVGAFAFGVFLVFVDIPEGNKRMVEMFADMFLFAGGLMVLNFFLGSSQSSKTNGEAIRKIADKQ